MPWQCQTGQRRFNLLAERQWAKMSQQSLLREPNDTRVTLRLTAPGGAVGIAIEFMLCSPRRLHSNANMARVSGASFE